MNWLHRLFNPHCSHCVESDREKKICNSCDILKMELARVRDENDRLLDRILEKPIVVESSAPTNMTKPSYVPWNTRRQMLENEDREKARLLKNAPKPDPANDIKVEELEKELGVSNAI